MNGGIIYHLGAFMSLTDLACKSAKAKEKPYKLSDSGGLYLEVMPTGSKCWRFKYRYLKKEKRLSLGVYPLTSLAEAREGRDKAKKQLLQNIDPSDNKRDVRKEAIRNADNTFKALALEWHENQKQRLTAKYYKNVLTRLEADIFPHIGKTQVTKIQTPDILDVLKKVADRGAVDLVIRLRHTCGQIFRYGIQTRKCTHNPVWNLKGALPTRTVKHFAAIETNEIPELLQALEQNDARLFPTTRRAIKLSMLTFVRPGELRKAKWTQFNFIKKEWHIPAENMKSRRAHIVPLCKQAITILEEQKRVTEHLTTEYIFPGQVKPQIPMSDATVRLALRRLGFKDRMTAHGFRALARTAIREELDYAPDVIEFQLAHKATGPMGATYDRAQFIKQRHKMMQDWADYLDKVLSQSRNKVVHANFTK